MERPFPVGASEVGASVMMERPFPVGASEVGASVVFAPNKNIQRHLYWYRPK